MRRELLDFLVCPDCQVSLECESEVERANQVESGSLLCPECDSRFPIVRGIPRFVTEEQPLQGKNVETANAFGWEWQEFSELHKLERYREQFLDWIEPLRPSFFEGKVVLDAGCGMGRFSMVSSEFGAREVIAVDASDAVEAAQRNARSFSNVHVVQADIHHLPLRRGEDGQMDFIFSIGVLHHLDDPEAGFRALSNHLHPAGSLFAWVYGRENNGWLVRVVNPVRIAVTSRLPRRLLYYISLLITAILHPIARYVYRPIGVSDLPDLFARALPYHAYISWLGQFGFHHNHHVVFDHLVAPVAHYIRLDSFISWFRNAELEPIHLSHRNRNSWRGHGRRREVTDSLAPSVPGGRVVSSEVGPGSDS